MSTSGPARANGLEALAVDLTAEQDSLDAVVGPLDDARWDAPTPSPGWSIRDQIAHLAYFDGTAATAILDPAGFQAGLAALLIAAAPNGPSDSRETAGAEPIGEATKHYGRLVGTAEQARQNRAAASGWTDRLETLDAATLMRDGPASQVLTRWRTNRSALGAAARLLGNADRLPWYGPSMSAKSFLTARLMETWAHGQDVVDALRSRADRRGDQALRPPCRDCGASRGGPTEPGRSESAGQSAQALSVDRWPTDRLRHIARLGFITRGWTYANRGEPMPSGDVRLALTGPAGDPWDFGPPDATDQVRGPALDFCLVVTQRRHVDDTGLDVVGAAARDWMTKAQAYAGPPTDGPAPRAGASAPDQRRTEPSR